MLLTDIARNATRTPPRLDDGMRERLRAAPWLGNVRELRNALERALILADGDVLRPDHLWLEDVADAPAPTASSLAEMERETIERTLATVGGNRRAAAEKLGIGLRTLYDKLKRYGLR